MRTGDSDQESPGFRDTCRCIDTRNNSPRSTTINTLVQDCDTDHTIETLALPVTAAHVRFVQPTITTDQQCRTILRRHAAGELPGDLARRLIAEELHRSGIAASVAGEKNIQQSLQVKRDLTDEMQTLLFSKTVQTTPGGFSLNYSENETSTTAWARQLLRAARPSLMRNLVNRAGKTDLVDPMPAESDVEMAVQPTSYTVFHSAVAGHETDSEMDERKKQDAADWLRSKTRHLRDNSKLAAQAATICYGFSVPQLVRPMLDERRRLKALVDADPTLAHTSARYMLSLVERGAAAPAATVDHGLTALWDDYTAENLSVIVNAHSRMALALVDHALADRARPSRNVLRSFRASVRALGQGKGWNLMAEELCEVFIALEFEAYSAFDSTATAFREERVAGRLIDCQKAPEVFNRAVARSGHPFGQSVEDLYAQLDRFIRELTDLEVKAPNMQAA